MKSIFVIILAIFLQTLLSETFGQTIESYSLSLSISYLPGGTKTTERYSKNGIELKHQINKSTYDFYSHNWVTTKQKKIKKDKKIESTINLLDSLFRMNEIKITVDKSLIESIKSDTYWEKSNNLDINDIEYFFSYSNTVVLKYKDIPPPEYEGFVIDGAPYSFELLIKKTNQDTLKYCFEGNFYDDVDMKNVKNWLIFNTVYKQRKFFKKLPLDYYFNNKNLETVLRRCIIWKKNTKQ